MTEPGVTRVWFAAHTASKEAQVTIRVLSIDGGGVRGILPAAMLATLEDRSGHSTADLFDMAVGTSTGGILTLGLFAPNASGRPAHTARELLELYHARGGEIFPLGGEPTVGYSGLLGKRSPLPPNASVGERFRNFMGYENIEKLVAPLGGHRNSRYSAVGLERVLHDSLGDVGLKQALKPVVITSYDYDTRQPVLFRSYNGHDPLMREVARATSAGPTFFPAATITGSSGQYIDGGVFANDPALVAFMEALWLAGDNARPQDILLVSLGTGMPKGDVAADDDVPAQLVDGMNWAELATDHLMTAIFNGAAQAQRNCLEQVLNTSQHHRYWRYQTVLQEASFAMDDARTPNLTALQREADRLIGENTGSFEPLLSLLTAS